MERINSIKEANLPSKAVFESLVALCHWCLDEPPFQATRQIPVKQYLELDITMAL